MAIKGTRAADGGGGNRKGAVVHVMIRWRVKPTEVKRELELLAAVYEEMRSVGPDGLVYNTFQLEDNVTFVAFIKMESGLGVLQTLRAFQQYRATLDDRCDEPPVVTTLHEVGCYKTS